MPYLDKRGKCHLDSGKFTKRNRCTGGGIRGLSGVGSGVYRVGVMTGSYNPQTGRSEVGRWISRHRTFAAAQKAAARLDMSASAYRKAIIELPDGTQSTDF